MYRTLFALSLLGTTALGELPPSGTASPRAAQLAQKYGDDVAEGVYYRSFSRDARRAAPNDQEREKDFQRAELVFAELRRLMVLNGEFVRIRRGFPAVATEWETRLRHTNVSFGSTSGASYRLLRPRGPAMATKDLQLNTMRALLDANGDVTSTPFLHWMPTERSPDNDAGKAFLLAHAMTHLIHWAPPSVIRCLSASDGYGARRAPDLDRLTAVQRAFLTLVLLHPDQTLKSADDAKAVLEKLDFKIDSDEYHAVIREGREFLQLFASCRTGLDRESQNTVARGWGTKPLPFFERSWRVNEKAAQRLFELVKKYQLPMIPEGDRFEDQIPNAVADFYATEFTVDYIRANFSPNRHRAAAISVLSLLAPVDGPATLREIYDYVGQRKTDETRALRILLANPNFILLLGVPSQNKPRYCGEVP